VLSKTVCAVLSWSPAPVPLSFHTKPALALMGRHIAAQVAAAAAASFNRFIFVLQG
jgi:hypothetical protein